MAASVFAGRARVKGRVSKVAAAIQDHLLTLCGLAAADVAGFQVWHHGGWFVVAASLLVLDYQLRG
jgi:uncharacterized membrane protein SirB2